MCVSLWLSLGPSSFHFRPLSILLSFFSFGKMDKGRHAQVQPIACVWVRAFVCLSLMSDNGRAILCNLQTCCHTSPHHNSKLNAKHTDISVKQEREAKITTNGCMLTSTYLVTNEKHQCKKDKKKHREEERVCEREEVHLKRIVNTGERSWAQWLRHREVWPLQIPSFLISSSRWKNSGRQDYAGQLRFLPKPWLDRLLREP